MLLSMERTVGRARTFWLSYRDEFMHERLKDGDRIRMVSKVVDEEVSGEEKRTWAAQVDKFHVALKDFHFSTQWLSMAYLVVWL